MSSIENVKKYFEREFLPVPGTQVSEQARVATALEYIAHQLGQIKVELRKLNETEN
ncbi:hypothetical protein KUV46_06355 [Thalassovita mediterranea]|nr:hypothetical protein KUV46_06355 [Thalassovita mediterranea]